MLPSFTLVSMKLKDIYKYILSDYTRYYGFKKRWNCEIILTALVAKNHCFTYSFWLRLASFRNPFFYFARYKHWHLSRKYGIQIPAGTKIGYGFYIGHGIGIVINCGTIIGNNVNISQFLSIGTTKKTPAIISDNVYIGPHVCIVEDVNIGNNTTIGAGAVVVNDVPDNATVVGCPAHVINYNTSKQFIQNKWV